MKYLDIIFAGLANGLLSDVFMHFCAVALCIGLSSATALGASQLPSVTGTDPDSLVELKDDSSRADLFALIVNEATSKTKEDNKQSAGPSDHKGQPPMKPFALIEGFAFPRDAVYDNFMVRTPRMNSIFGIDISHYTSSDIPLKALRQSKVTFVYAKATQGASFKDGKFSFFWKALDELPAGEKVHRGAYHFLTAKDDAATQAGTFLKFLAANGGLKNTDMPPVLDLEWDKTKSEPDRWKGQDPDAILQKALTWLRIVNQQTGRIPLLYTSAAWWRERGIQEKKLFERLRFCQCKIWIADYSKSSRAVEVPKIPIEAPWKLWQFSDRAKLPSDHEQRVDVSIFKGPRKQFYSDFGLANFQEHDCSPITDKFTGQSRGFGSKCRPNGGHR